MKSSGDNFNNIYITGSRVLRHPVLDTLSESLYEDDLLNVTRIRELISERDCVS